MGRWRVALLIFNHVSRTPFASQFLNPSRSLKPLNFSTFFNPSLQFVSRKRFSAIPSRVPVYTSDSEYGSADFCHTHELISKGKDVDDEECVKIPVKAYFLCTSIDLKSMQAENLRNVVPPSSRSSNYIALRYCNLSSEVTALGVKEKVSSCRYMVVFQYGSTVLFNIEDNDVESYLEIVRRHASGLLPEVRKDDFAVKEQAQLGKDMQGEPDCIVLKILDTDSIRIIGSVLGQSIALDYFVSQVDGMVEEFAGLNRAMEKTGTFTMDRKKLIQLVGKANSNLAGVILKVGLFDRSEIAWRDAKYALIYEYLREEYEVNQRFGNLDFKLKFVEHNIQFLQEVIQNRRSDLVEWCIIFLLAVENILSIYEIVRSSTGGAG